MIILNFFIAAVRLQLEPLPLSVFVHKLAEFAVPEADRSVIRVE